MFDPVAFQRDFSSAGRRHGDRALGARVELLVTAAAEPDLVELVDTCWRQGDNDERRAVLKSLARLPQPERFVPLAIAACRLNVVPVFEAIACDNPFPARHFPEAAFNQMVLKALFVGVAIERITGLRDRVTPELERMAAAYASERRAAGRDVSEDTERLATGRMR